jgi:hypothetical protein
MKKEAIDQNSFSFIGMSVAISVTALFVWPKKFLFSNTSERPPLGGSLFCISRLPRLPQNVNAYPPTPHRHIAPPPIEKSARH